MAPLPSLSSFRNHFKSKDGTESKSAAPKAIATTKPQPSLPKVKPLSSSAPPKAAPLAKPQLFFPSKVEAQSKPAVLQEALNGRSHPSSSEVKISASIEKSNPPPHKVSSKSDAAELTATLTGSSHHPLAQAGHDSKSATPNNVPAKAHGKEVHTRQSNGHAGPRKIGVFLGKNGNIPAECMKLAEDAGDLFFQKQWTYVYGGSSPHSMGILADRVASLGGKLHGVKPRAMKKHTPPHQLPAFTANEVVDDHISQMRRIAQLVDAFIFLPGGFTASEELQAVHMWYTIVATVRPLVLLNYKGHFDHLLSSIDSETKSGKIPRSSANAISTVNSLEELPGHLARCISASKMEKSNKIDSSTSISDPYKAASHPTGKPLPITTETRRLPPTGSQSKNEKPPIVEQSVHVPARNMQEGDRELTRALEVADKITRRLALFSNWSTWHAWNYLQNQNSNPSALNPSMWQKLSPFTTCVGLAFSIAVELQAAFKSMKDFQLLASKVQTMAIVGRNPSGPDAEERSDQCIVALFLGSSCILIDAFFSPIPIKLHKGKAFETIRMTTVSGRSISRTYSFLPSNELVVMDPGSNDWQKIRPITQTDALKNITLLATLEKEPGTKLPTPKQIVIRRNVREAPKLIPFVPLGKKSWAMESCRLEINFKARSLTLQVPVTDWLAKLDKKNRDEVSTPPNYRKVSDALGHIVVEIPRAPPGKDTKDNDRRDTSAEKIKGLDILTYAAGELGLKKAVIDEVVKSIYAVQR